MKHIKKKFLFVADTEELLKISPDAQHIDWDKASNSIFKNSKDKVVNLIKADNTTTSCLVENINGEHLPIPIPDFTLVYFNYAQLCILPIEESRKKLISKLRDFQNYNEDVINEIYESYGLSFSFVMNLFSAIESFMNQIIPDDFVYENKLNSKTELYNKVQIQETLDFKTKINKVILQATKRSFPKSYNAEMQHITNLKEFRDSIIHTKHSQKPYDYKQIMRRILKFKYERTLEATSKFMNYYKKDYIIECDCGKDF